MFSTECLFDADKCFQTFGLLDECLPIRLPTETKPFVAARMQINNKTRPVINLLMATAEGHNFQMLTFAQSVYRPDRRWERVDSVRSGRVYGLRCSGGHFTSDLPVYVSNLTFYVSPFQTFATANLIWFIFHVCRYFKTIVSNATSTGDTIFVRHIINNCV